MGKGKEGRKGRLVNNEISDSISPEKRHHGKNKLAIDSIWILLAAKPPSVAMVNRTEISLFIYWSLECTHAKKINNNFWKYLTGWSVSMYDCVRVKLAGSLS